MRMPTRVTRSATAAAVALTLLCSPTALRSSGSPTTITAHGLSAPVEVTTDRHGIPHVRAATLSDLYFAWGWVSARDRLWQMVYTRAAAEGQGVYLESTNPRNLSFYSSVGFASLGEFTLRNRLLAVALGIVALAGPRLAVIVIATEPRTRDLELGLAGELAHLVPRAAVAGHVERLVGDAARGEPIEGVIAPRATGLDEEAEAGGFHESSSVLREMLGLPVKSRNPHHASVIIVS